MTIHDTRVTATTPIELMERFADRVAEGDLDGLVALYAPDAVFEAEPGVESRGGEIRVALGEMLALRPTITYTAEARVLEVGDIALVSNEWTMVGTAPDGTIVRQGGVSADVVRREPDGSWRVLIDQPRGVPQ